MIWMVTDDRWNNTLHRPIHVAGLYLNPAFSYIYGFKFDSEVMSNFFECVQMMVPSAADRLELSQEWELYKRSIGLFGFEMAINDRKNIMLSKFHLVLTFKFQNSFFKFQFVFSYVSLIHCRYLVGKLWRKGTYSTDVGNTKTTERGGGGGGESVVTVLKQFYAY
jgi:hypothetical protein